LLLNPPEISHRNLPGPCNALSNQYAQCTVHVYINVSCTNLPQILHLLFCLLIYIHLYNLLFRLCLADSKLCACSNNLTTTTHPPKAFPQKTQLGEEFIETSTPKKARGRVRRGRAREFRPLYSSPRRAVLQGPTLDEAGEGGSEQLKGRQLVPESVQNRLSFLHIRLGMVA
jgi:hypothetical protein